MWQYFWPHTVDEFLVVVQKLHVFVEIWPIAIYWSGTFTTQSYTWKLTKGRFIPAVRLYICLYIGTATAHTPFPVFVETRNEEMWRTCCTGNLYILYSILIFK
jgi:hypothetical protein